MSQNKINIAILLGDPSGIGPELVSKLLTEKVTNKANIVVIGEKKILEEGNKISGKSVDLKYVESFDDINFEHRPKDLPFFYRKYYKHYFPKYCQLADKIITVSKFSKNDISEKYNIKIDKISVVYNGVSSSFFSTTFNKKALKNKYSSGEDYFIFIGSLHKRKNIGKTVIKF